MQVQEIMTPGARVIDPNTNIAEAARAMRADNIGALPVGENDRLIGMVTDRDIAMRGAAEERPAGNTAVRQVMSEHIYYCFEDQDVEQAAKVMAGSTKCIGCRCSTAASVWSACWRWLILPVPTRTP